MKRSSSQLVFLLIIIAFNANAQIPIDTRVELRWDANTPYIDFSNDNSVDYDARIILQGDNSLNFLGTNIGINLSSPAATLHIRDGQYWSSHNFGASLVIDGAHHNALGIFDSSNSNPIAMANVGGKLSFTKMPALSNTSTPPVYLFEIQPTGQVQIGTANSGSQNKRLIIPGTYNFEETNLSVGSNGNGELEFITHSTSTNSGGVKLYSSDGANLHFQTASPQSSAGSLTYSTKMLITNDGRVGIGTLNTNGYKLAVEGVIGAREINVNTSTWSDYVFYDDYKLPSLDTVEKYIRQNQHLPEIPSAKEVGEKGVNVGEMNALLLKKIEELTLYVIDLKKEVDSLKARN